MIKLERNEAPTELTEKVCAELTELYQKDHHKDVWNSQKIKEPLKKALLKMSHQKCAYCECKLSIESKDMTIDHFLPKSSHPGKVVEWENLFPSCLRCNRKKNDYEEQIINPCENNPKEYLAISKKSPFRLLGIDSKNIGKNTLISVGLNDIERVMTPRMQEWEMLNNHLFEILEDLTEMGYQKKYKNRLEIIMEKCTKNSSYSAIKATNLLNSDVYLKIKKLIINEGEWSHKFIELENEIQEISLQLI